MNKLYSHLSPSYSIPIFYFYSWSFRSPPFFFPHKTCPSSESVWQSTFFTEPSVILLNQVFPSQSLLCNSWRIILPYGTEWYNCVICFRVPLHVEYRCHGSVGKESTCNVGDTREANLIPGSGRSPGGGNGNPFQYSCLEYPMDRGALAGYSPWGCKESAMTEPAWMPSLALRI